MRAFAQRQAVRLWAYAQPLLKREAKSVKREVKKYESTVVLFGVGSIWILIGRFSGIFLVSAVGGLILAYGILQLLR